MQGNERKQTRIDAPFTDHAWAEMRSMLDQEMPVTQSDIPTPQRKHYALFLLFLLFGFIAGVGTMMYFNQEEVPIEKEKKKPLEDIASLENNAHKNISSKPAASSAFGGGGQSPSAHLSSNNSSSNTENSLLHHQESQLVDDNSKNLTNENNNKPDQKPVSAGVRFTDITNPVDGSLLTSLSAQSVEESAFLKALMILPEFEDYDQKMSPVAWNHGGKIRFGMRIGSLSQQFRDFTGISAGLVLNIPLEQNFSIETGIHYSMLCGFKKNLDGSQVNYSPFENSRVENRINLNQVSTIQPIGVNQALPIENLHYINLPLLLSFQPIERFKIHMGLKASYLVYADANLAKHEFSGSSSVDPNLEFRTDHDQALYESMKKFDFNTVLGFGYYPRKNFGIDLRYHHGLIDTTIDEVWQARQISTNKAFELSLIYLFDQ